MVRIAETVSRLAHFLLGIVEYEYLMAPLNMNRTILTRYRPAALVVLGAATVYCMCLVYANLKTPDSPKTPLQRRGAIHRRRHGSESLQG